MRVYVRVYAGAMEGLTRGRRLEFGSAKGESSYWGGGRRTQRPDLSGDVLELADALGYGVGYMVNRQFVADGIKWTL